MAVVSATVLVNVAFITAAPIMRQVSLSWLSLFNLTAFYIPRRKEYFKYDFWWSLTSIQVEQFSFTAMNSYIENPSLYRCSGSMAQTGTFLIRKGRPCTASHCTEKFFAKPTI